MSIDFLGKNLSPVELLEIVSRLSLEPLSEVNGENKKAMAQIPIEVERLNKIWTARVNCPQRILEEQNRKLEETASVVSMVEELRRKPNWTEKVTNLDLRKVYYDEAIAQGISQKCADKALSILETLSQCYRSSPLSDHDMETDQKDSIPLKVRVGESDFDTSTDILTADIDSMLNRKFGSVWFQPPTSDEPVVINTASNSSSIFSRILTYLNALKNGTPNQLLCPNLKEMTATEINLLRQDCDYLGLRRLSIAIEVSLGAQCTSVIEQQKKTANTLAYSKRKLTSLVDEQRRISGQTSSYHKKRLKKLFEEMENEQETVNKVSAERQQASFPKSCSVGDAIKINPPDTSTWFDYIVKEIDGSLMASRERYHQPDEIIPIPAPTHYYISSDEVSWWEDGIVYADKILPERLSQSLVHQFDDLLHRMPLDIHPGSNCQVIDLIHPSMYPYIKGLTQLSDQAAFEACAKVNGSDYAWLPSEFDVDKDGVVTISSYINNLDRDEATRLYEDIGMAFQTMLPMFESVLEKQLTSSKLQVIVKAAYYLIPPGESYSGSWHLEGMPQEHIVAAGIYYLDVSENIRCNRLNFRKELPEDYYHEEDRHHRAGEEIDLIEDLGSIDTESQRAIVWANHLQHQVAALSVAADDTQAGIRKILCFFLVDPDVKVISTEIVPKQQDVIPLEVALEHRQKLMNERKYHADKVTGMWEERKYTFCEH